ncbi:MAG: hypothetical protein ACW99G_01680 [Candidatus Thorarchaeota archaeon]|jgi:hypothetical protein
MPKGKGMQTWPGGTKFPDVGTGTEVRPINPGQKKGSKGAQVFNMGHKFGSVQSDDMLKGHNPGKAKGKGPQTHKSSRLGDTKNQNQDPSRFYNPH